MDHKEISKKFETIKKTTGTTVTTFSELVLPYIQEGMVIVDIGCGTAKYFSCVLKKFHDVELIGIDISEKIIEKNKKIYSKFPNISFITANATKIPLKENSADIVLCLGGVISYAPNTSQNADLSFLKEIKRILKKDSFAIINFAVWLDDSLVSGYNTLNMGYEDVEEKGLFFRVYTRKWISENLSKLNFEIIGAHEARVSKTNFFSYTVLVKKQ